MLWWSLVASLLIYVVVAYVVVIPSSPTAPVEYLVPVFALLCFAIAAGTLRYRRKALVRPIQTGELDTATPQGLERAFKPFMINLVLSESVGIYGLVLAFLSGSPMYSLAFAAAALVLMYLHRPTAPDLVSPISGHTRGIDSNPIA